jgi:uncharacterized protein (TIGR03067 family)
MKPSMKKLFITVSAIVILAGCSSHREFHEREQVTDANLNGTWLVRKAELGGKDFIMPAAFELQIADNKYRAGVQPAADRGKLLFFGDELAGQAARMDVVGEDGPNKGKRYPAIYRFNGRELEICYDLTGNDRPSEFVSREGTMLLRVTYAKK